MKGRGRLQLRLFWIGAALVILAAEVAIALWVHDRVVRPYVGDALAVIWLYCVVRIGWRRPSWWLPWAVFGAAVAVELVQYLELGRRLGLLDNPVLRILLGSFFDWADIACYLAGTLLLTGGQFLEIRINRAHCAQEETER